MKKLIALVLTLTLFLCSCSGGTSEAATTTKPAETTMAPKRTEAAVTTTEVIETTAPPSHANEKGPFSDTHYEIGMRALQSLDAYFDGDVTLSGVKKTLESCHKDISDLPELPESDPLYEGNDFVKTYVFLAFFDFTMGIDDFDTKKYEDRNYLAKALGEPEREYSLSDSFEKKIDDYLNGAWDGLKEKSPDSSFSHSWNDGNLFIEINIPQVDYFYENWDSLDEETKTSVLEIVHGYVSGGFAEPLYSGIRERGGSGFTVYFVLVGEEVYCASADLRIISDLFDK